MESSETWRTKALKSFAISKSGMQGGEAKRNLPWSNFLWQSCQTLLEHLLELKLCILYFISKLGKSSIQRFKQCMIRSWNEGVTAIANWSLQAEGRILHSAAKSPFCCEMISQPFCTVLWNSSWSFPIFPNTLEAKHRKLKANLAALRNQLFAAKWFRNPFCASAKSRRPCFHLRNAP